MTHEQLVEAVYEKQLSLAKCISKNCAAGYGNCKDCSENLVREYENEIRKDERTKVHDELENKLRIWDNKVNAIPNYVWKCIEEMKGGTENEKP